MGPKLAALAVLACGIDTTADGWWQRPAQPPARSPSQPAPGEMLKAVEAFKAATRELGLRTDSPRRGPRNGRAAGWHGRLFHNFRNDFLDAVPHEVLQRGAEKSMLRRNQFGFNLAGPLVIPHLYRGPTYFSVSYEGFRDRVARSYLRTIPTLAERRGDWSETVDAAGSPLPVFDPLTTRRNPAFDATQPVSEDNLEYPRQPFPANRIPETRLDAVAQRALAYYPAPNASVGPFFRNNFFVHAPEGNTANGMIAKFDHSLRERHRLSLGLSFSNGLLSTAKWFANAANPGPPDRRFHSRRASLEHVLAPSARTVNSLTFEAASDASRSGIDDATSYPAALGLAGSPGRVFPAFALGPYVSMGRGNPVSRNARAGFTWTESFSTRRGRHGLRATARYSRLRVNSFWPAYPSGRFLFSHGLTSLPGIVNTGHAFASFLLGLAEYSQWSLVTAPSYFRNGSAVVALRDSYEAAQGLTFSIALNVNTATPRTEKYDRQSTVDLNAPNPADGRAGALAVACRGPWGRAFQPVRTKLEPSAGIAWSPRGDPKTVIRAAYGRSYAAIPIYSGQWGTQGFNGTPTLISDNVQLDPAVRLSDGLPPPPRPAPDLRPEAVNNTVADLVDTSDRQPVYQSASLTFEREVPGSVLLTAGAAYSGGRNLLVSNGAANPNAIPLDNLRYRDQLNDESFNRSLRPYPQYKGFDVYSAWPIGRYQRDAAFLRVEKRASQGLTLTAYYEFSKQLDDYSGPYGRQDVFNRSNEWSLTAYNNPHRLSLSYMYELPLGPSRMLLNYSDWRRYLIGGWSLSGVTSFASGTPLALRPMFNNTGGVVTALNVNVVPGVDPHVAQPGPEAWFNPAAFDQPPDFTPGNASRTHPSLRGPISQNHDLSVAKRFALAAGRAIEFSAVGLNFLNHANWYDPDATIGPASSPNVNAGRIIGSRGGRVIQLGLRLTF